MLLDLGSGELRDGDDGITLACRSPGLLREALPELGRGVVSGHDKQIMKGGYGAARGSVHPLVERVEQVRPRSASQYVAARVRRQRAGKRFEEAMRAVIETETLAGMRTGEAE